MAEKSRKLVINSAWCKGCGICAAFCPKGALEISEEKVRRKEGTECVLCGQCELRCPDYAIYIKETEDGGKMQWAKQY
jgi:2-oxoglutarate ferredoxin oxidoreductase subunit delta